jgi:hypothetical protein
MDISVTTLDLYFAAGHIIGENFGSVSGLKRLLEFKIMNFAVK